MTSAGERIRAEARDQAGREAAQLWRQRDPEGWAAWRAGTLIPARITTWLDLRGLEGPEVDIACGVTEPAVDLWEQGRLYPTWWQCVWLARLVGAHSVAVFARETPAVGVAIVCSSRPRRCEVVVPDPEQLSFRPAAVAGIRDDGGVDGETLW